MRPATHFILYRHSHPNPGHGKPLIQCLLPCWLAVTTPSSVMLEFLPLYTVHLLLTSLQVTAHKQLVFHDLNRHLRVTHVS